MLTRDEKIAKIEEQIRVLEDSDPMDAVLRDALYDELDDLYGDKYNGPYLVE